MPELPDITIYIEALEPRIVGRAIEHIRVRGPLFVRSFDPPVEAAETRRVNQLSRLGKRIVFELTGDLYIVMHLMIAGRFRWYDQPGQAIPGKVGVAAFDFEHGTLLVTEAATQKRASMHLVRCRPQLAAHDPGGLEVLDADLDAFTAALQRENHTLKQSLTDPRLLSGIGNAYSDEILHTARLSPLKQTDKLSADEITRLYDATLNTLKDWTARLRRQFAGRFPRPGDITAFRPVFAVHGKFDRPCPVCDTRIQRICYAGHETNYCPRCQTAGRLLADRSLSRLLKKDWPKTIEQLEG